MKKNVCKVFPAALSLLLIVCLTGCGHNMVAYSDGVGLETTINPETYTVGLSFRYGKIFTAAVRENAKVKMNGTGSGQGALASSGILASVTGDSASSSTNKNSTDNSSASADGALEIEIGDQITGYLVDLAKVDKSLAQKIIEAKISKAASDNKKVASDNKNDDNANKTTPSGTGTTSTTVPTATDTSGTK